MKPRHVRKLEESTSDEQASYSHATCIAVCVFLDHSSACTCGEDDGRLSKSVVECGLLSTSTSRKVLLVMPDAFTLQPLDAVLQ